MACALRTPWQPFFGSLTPVRTAYFGSPRLLLHRQNATAHNLAREHLHADDVRGPSLPQAFCKFGVRRYRHGGVAPAFLGRDLHRHLANDLVALD
jgi:hypothetical protein